jgi:hypothetical protein
LQAQAQGLELGFRNTRSKRLDHAAMLARLGVRASD